MALDAPAWHSASVALLAEGVDRNWAPSSKMTVLEVALLAEGVDRNYVAEVMPEDVEESPSSRRAWIEILTTQYSGPMRRVALLAEGVDRNLWWLS